MRLRNKIVTALVVLGLAVTPVIAQRQGWWAGVRGNHFQRNPERMVEHVATILDLTDAQKQAAKNLFSDAKTHAEPIVSQLKEGHQSMEDAVKNGKSDAEISNIAAQQGNRIGQLAAIHAKAMARFYVQLTPEQQSKAARIHDQFKSRWMGHFRAPKSSE